MPATDDDKSEAGADRAFAGAQAQFSGEVVAAQSAAQEVKDSQDGLLQRHQTTMTEWLAATLRALDVEQDAIQDATDKAVATEGLKTDQIKRLNDEMAQQLKQIAHEVSEAQNKGAEDSVKKWEEAAGQINNAITGQIDGLLKGTESWGTAFKKIIADIAEDLIKSGVTKILTGGENAIGGAMGIGPNAGNPMGAFATMFAPLTAALGVNTAATTLHTTATATQTTATAVSDAVTAANTTAQVTNTAAQSSSIVAWVSNTVATLANTVATDAAAIGKFFGFATGTPMVQQTGLALIHEGEAIVPAAMNPFKSLSSFDIGAWSVPQDMVSLVHRNELVMPAAEAGAFRSMLSGAANGGGASGGDTHNHTHNWGGVHINARNGKLDPDDVMKAMGEAVSKGAHLNAAFRNLVRA